MSVVVAVQLSEANVVGEGEHQFAPEVVAEGRLERCCLPRKLLLSLLVALGEGV